MTIFRLFDSKSSTVRCGSSRNNGTRALESRLPRSLDAHPSGSTSAGPDIPAPKLTPQRPPSIGSPSQYASPGRSLDFVLSVNPREGSSRFAAAATVCQDPFQLYTRNSVAALEPGGMTPTSTKARSCSAPSPEFLPHASSHPEINSSIHSLDWAAEPIETRPLLGRQSKRSL